MEYLIAVIRLKAVRFDETLMRFDDVPYGF